MGHSGPVSVAIAFRVSGPPAHPQQDRIPFEIGASRPSGAMSFLPLKSFFSTADELLLQDLPTLGGALLVHLRSYKGLNTVYQHAGLNRAYLRAMLENRNIGL